MAEYKSFYKVVGGNEGSKCHYPARLDLYGCGCEHDCKYCYAKSLLNFRKLWNPMAPSVADLAKVQRIQTRQSGYKATEQRLYAYPVLVDNVRNRWPKDIEDLKREPVGQVSKSIVKWSVQGGVKISPEERQEARILALQAKLERDRQELAVMDRALNTIKTAPAYPWLTKFYFDGKDMEAMSEE